VVVVGLEVEPVEGVASGDLEPYVPEAGKVPRIVRVIQREDPRVALALRDNGERGSAESRKKLLEDAGIT
jgi:hypothetical protein